MQAKLTEAGMDRNTPDVGATAVVVNDDVIQLQIFTGLLRKGGFTCEGFTSAEDALAGMSMDAPPSIIVTDLHMPGIDGWRFCRLLRSVEFKAYNNVPILAVSATFAGKDTREITAATGADAFLPSPVAPETFLNTVRGLLHGRAPEQRHARILLIDDSSTICTLLSRSFVKNGYESFTAGDGAEARRLFNQVHPEIVVIDYHLPDTSGEDLLREFAKSGHFSIFIMITTDPNPELAVRWMRMGAAAYARKPFDAEYLLKLCETAFRERVMIRVEDMLEQKTQSLIQAQKMEAVGQLAGGMAHDFNNLLQVMMGHIDMVLVDMDDDPMARRSLNEALKAADRARRLVTDLLTFSRRQATQTKPIDLTHLLEEHLEMIRRVIGEHISLEFQPGESMPRVLADPYQIEQVLLNLCINARDAMPDGGTLAIRLQTIEFDRDYCAGHRWSRPGQFACIEVADTGCGMPPEVRRRIFEPFFTTKQAGKGTGVGLATVYGIVKQNNGFLHVESEVGVGSVFRVYLPKVDDPLEIAQVAPAGGRDDGLGGTEMVLVAEDDEQVRTLAAGYLAEAGYHVLSAANGEEALCILVEYEQEIDLMVLDVVMPERGGRQVVEAARERSLTTPVLFVSGYSFEELDAFHLPADIDLLPKPFTRRDLLAQVRRILSAKANDAGQF